MDLDPTLEDAGDAHEGGGAPPRARPLHHGSLVAPLTCFFCLYNSIYPAGTLPEGESFSSGHLHHPGALHDEEGVVLPRG